MEKQTDRGQVAELEVGPKPISVLSSEVIDQIAAGEVVERPAHLVKELVENAVDAGASEIEIDFEAGGRQVRILDNGLGILEKDLPKALARHATSKIQSAEELWSVQSFGFRGEALASIASVSRLEIVSRPRNSSAAARINSEFGRIGEVEPSAGNFGTLVHVQDLFENVPARLKFMKSESAEATQIKLVVRALAMSHPEVGFRLRSKSKTEFAAKKNESFLTRCKSVVGVQLHQAQAEFEGVKVEIAFSGPQDVTGNSKGIWLFVQGRWVQDRSIQAAVMESYRGLLMHGEFPFVVARLSLAQGEVDVNIHPTKSAVKFRDPSRVFRAVSRTLRSELEKAPWVSASDQVASRGSATVTANSVRSSVSFTMQDFTRPYVAQPSLESDAMDRVQFQKKPSPLPQSTGKGVWSRLEILGQAHQTYIVCQDDSKLVLVDQHAAHERVAFERLMRAWKDKKEGGRVETQLLLLPIMIDLEDELIEELLKNQKDLEAIGIHVERMGPRIVSVNQIPTILKESVIAGALRKLAEHGLERGGSMVLEERIGDVFATMACHSVVRAGQALSVQEMRELLEQMDEFPLSSFCPHGRPVSIEYPFSQVERDFGRLV